jgi:hypothetical protein
MQGAQFREPKPCAIRRGTMTGVDENFDPRAIQDKWQALSAAASMQTIPIHPKFPNGGGLLGEPKMTVAAPRAMSTAAMTIRDVLMSSPPALVLGLVVLVPEEVALGAVEFVAVVHDDGEGTHHDTSARDRWPAS